MGQHFLLGESGFVLLFNSSHISIQLRGMLRLNLPLPAPSTSGRHLHPEVTHFFPGLLSFLPSFLLSSSHLPARSGSDCGPVPAGITSQRFAVSCQRAGITAGHLQFGRSSSWDVQGHCSPLIPCYVEGQAENPATA